MSSELEFTNKVVLITGSSGGLGAQTAKEFAKQGAQVVITGRNADRVASVGAECDCMSPGGLNSLQVVADVTVDDDLKRLVETVVEKLGRIDVLVNNAGAGSVAFISDPNLIKHLDHMFKLDVRSVVLLTQLCVPYLEASKGVIINISSLASLKPYGGCSAYCMAKASLDMFSKCISLELGPKGVRVNVINPTAVRTGFQANSGAGDIFDNVVDATEKSAPLGKLPDPVDIANAVLFMASSKSAFITGVTLPVDCGSLNA